MKINQLAKFVKNSFKEADFIVSIDRFFQSRIILAENFIYKRLVLAEGRGCSVVMCCKSGGQEVYSLKF